MTDQTHDERITAYLDGTMPDAELEAFEAEMTANPLLAAEVERLAANDSLLRQAFAEPSDHASDAAFLQRLGLAEPARVTGAAAVPLAANDNPPFWQRYRLPLGTGIAAALALALTFTLQNGAAPAPIGLALEQTPSGQMAALDNGASITPILTFKAGDGRFCREFTYTATGGDRGGIACRGDAGWAVEAWGTGVADLPDPDEIALASGAGEASLDDVYSRLNAGDPLPIGAEKDLIAKGWK